MFSLITEKHKEQITTILNSIEKEDYNRFASKFSTIIKIIYDDIPDKKRISYGRYTVLKRMGPVLYPILLKREIDISSLSERIYRQTEQDWTIRALAVQLQTIESASTGNPDAALPLLEEAAADDSWEVRECASGFVRQLIFKNRKIMHAWYLKMVQSEDPMKRRFASESLRPVADNGWFKKNPLLVMDILKTDSYKYKNRKYRREDFQ